MNRMVYVRLTALTIDELPIEHIEGYVTGGSINADGKSVIRRTCNLTLVSPTPRQLSEYLWTLNTKFLLEIGTQDDDNELKWYKQGIFFITSFSASYTSNNCTISISGKDKGARLTGDIGGHFGSQIDFGQIEIIDKIKDTVTKHKLPIKQIIREMMHTYAQEPYHNIIIEDIDDYGRELQEYAYNDPLYLLREIDSSIYAQALLDGKTKVTLEDGKIIPLEALTDEYLEPLNDFSPVPQTTKPVLWGGETYIVAKILPGQTPGYKEIELVYPDELIANAGETIASILDKIAKAFGDFEYFYNVDGQFIFRKKLDYINTAWTPLVESDSDVYVDSARSQYSHIFTDTSTFTSLSNAPNISNLRNDFSVWGTRKGVGGADIPILMRYAIDIKPIAYTSIFVDSEDEYLKEYNNKYNTTLKGQDSFSYYTNEGKYIFQPVQDTTLKITSAGQLSASNILKIATNGEYQATDQILRINAKRDFGDFMPADESLLPTLFLELVQATEYDDGLDLYTLAYLDDENHTLVLYNNRDRTICCDWREVIYQMAKDYHRYGHLPDFEYRVREANPDLYPTGKTGYEQYYVDMYSLWPQLYSLTPEDPAEYYDSSIEGKRYWNKKVDTAPETLNFWFDFLDYGGELRRFNIPTIGDRTKVEHDNTVRAIYFNSTPTVIFVDKIPTEASQNTGYTYLQIGTVYESMFRKSTQGKTAKEAVDALLYKHTYCIDSININTIPIYDLQPNTRIYIKDEDSGIDGDYIISSFTIPLAYNGTSSITATKAADRLY